VKPALLGIAIGAFALQLQGTKVWVEPPPRPVRSIPRPNPADVLERLSRMSPEQQQRALAGLPPGMQNQLANGLKRLERLRPEERAEWLVRYRRFQQLSPLQKQEVRNMVLEFRMLPQPRRAAVKRELDVLRHLPEPDRTERLESPAFRNRFSPQERNMILIAAPVLPDF
jgi:hypothetical protein